MKRRRFLSSMAIILPATIVSTEFIFSSCKSGVKEEYFSEANIKLLDEIGETIIPTTSTSPGAKAAMIGEFMKVYVTDCYTTVQQNIFWVGINKVKKISKDKYGDEFQKLAILQKQDILRSLENESRNYKSKKEIKAGSGDAVQTGRAQQEIQSSINESTAQFYPLMKGLVLFGYFTSEPGATQALRYIQTPGSYKGDVSYKKGDKLWAT